MVMAWSTEIPLFERVKIGLQTTRLPERREGSEFCCLTGQTTTPMQVVAQMTKTIHILASSRIPMQVVGSDDEPTHDDSLS